MPAERRGESTSSSNHDHDLTTAVGRGRELAKLLQTAFAILALVPVHAADNPAKSGWNLELVPKAFQRDPRMEMTVITEMTAAGKERPPVSRQAPAYYFAHSGGYHAVGEKPGQVAFPAADIERILKSALGQNGFEPATPEHPPSLFITYTWGPDMYPDIVTDGVGNIISPSQEVLLQNVLDRAALAGGDKFASELKSALAFRVANTMTAPTPTDGLSAANGLAEMNRAMDPVKLFVDKSAKNEFLVSQAADDCYYVVASAYDYDSVATNHRQLLWRTRMTVNARAVSQAQSLPTLIAVAAPYLGREMAEAEVLVKRAVDASHVEIGDLKVIEMPAPTTSPTKGK